MSNLRKRVTSGNMEIAGQIIAYLSPLINDQKVSITRRAMSGIDNFLFKNTVSEQQYRELLAEYCRVRANISKNSFPEFVNCQFMNKKYSIRHAEYMRGDE